MTRTTSFPLTIALVVAALFAGAALPIAAKFPDAQESQVLRHIVMYKFKDSVPAEQVQEVIDAFSKLPKQIEGIVDFEHGTNTSAEGKSEGLTHIFVVTFRNPAALAAYLKHPAHDAYVQVVKDRREKVVVFDYLTDAK